MTAWPSESKRSAAVTEIGIKSQLLAEDFKAGNAVLTPSILDGAAKRDGDEIIWYYDKDLNAAGAELSYFTFTCTVETSDNIGTATMVLTEGENELFRYGVSKYLEHKAVG